MLKDECIIGGYHRILYALKPIAKALKMEDNVLNRARAIPCDNIVLMCPQDATYTEMLPAIDKLKAAIMLEMEMERKKNVSVLVR